MMQAPEPGSDVEDFGLPGFTLEGVLRTLTGRGVLQIPRLVRAGGLARLRAASSPHVSSK